jgi:hypothetical protein
MNRKRDLADWFLGRMGANSSSVSTGNLALNGLFLVESIEEKPF